MSMSMSLRSSSGLSGRMSSLSLGGGGGGVRVSSSRRCLQVRVRVSGVEGGGGGSVSSSRSVSSGESRVRESQGKEEEEESVSSSRSVSSGESQGCQGSGEEEEAACLRPGACLQVRTGLVRVRTRAGGKLGRARTGVRGSSIFFQGISEVRTRLGQDGSGQNQSWEDWVRGEACRCRLLPGSCLQVRTRTRTMTEVEACLQVRAGAGVELGQNQGQESEEAAGACLQVRTGIELSQGLEDEACRCRLLPGACLQVRAGAGVELGQSQDQESEEAAHLSRSVSAGQKTGPGSEPGSEGEAACLHPGTCLQVRAWGQGQSELELDVGLGQRQGSEAGVRGRGQREELHVFIQELVCRFVGHGTERGVRERVKE
ncbi:hypothetical protein WMY93_033720 [Mugilogobius chulae]|uniref:Uncharacterized protein n=1 Tax=Mugilogobius chulae TaxID=88201 RepID=A0AAW0MRY9_9GOBI